MVAPKNIVFFGTPAFSLFTLSQLTTDERYNVKAVVTQPDRPAGRGEKIKASPVKTYALKKNIPVLEPQNIRKNVAGFLKELTNHGPYDIGVVVAFGQILPQQVLDFPVHGCVNIHASLLPRWRGAAPIQRAIMAGDTSTGVCIMQMEAGLDTGAVYASTTISIQPEDDLGSLHDKLGIAGATLLCESLLNIISGKSIAAPQSQEGITYASKISSAETLIAWSESAQHISLLVRGLSPAPGAYTYLEGKRLKIFRATPKPTASSQTHSTAGEVSFVDTRTLEIQCGKDILSLEIVQLEGKNRMAIADFLRGVHISKGTILGNR